MRDILKYGYKLSFLYNPSNAEFSNNYSALKNSEFADESSKDMLRAGTMKESLAKTSGNRSTVSVNKRKRFQTLDMRKSDPYKDKTKFGDWKNVQLRRY